MFRRDNQNLFKHIDDRKKYSESLKAKICKLKDQVKDLSSP